MNEGTGASLSIPPTFVHINVLPILSEVDGKSKKKKKSFSYRNRTTAKHKQNKSTSQDCQ